MQKHLSGDQWASSLGCFCYSADNHLIFKTDSHQHVDESAATNEWITVAWQRVTDGYLTAIQFLYYGLWRGPGHGSAVWWSIVGNGVWELDDLQYNVWERSIDHKHSHIQGVIIRWDGRMWSLKSSFFCLHNHSLLMHRESCLYVASVCDRARRSVRYLIPKWLRSW